MVVSYIRFIGGRPFKGVSTPTIGFGLFWGYSKYYMLLYYVIVFSEDLRQMLFEEQKLSLENEVCFLLHKNILLFNFSILALS